MIIKNYSQNVEVLMKTICFYDFMIARNDSMNLLAEHKSIDNIHALIKSN